MKLLIRCIFLVLLASVCLNQEAQAQKRYKYKSGKTGKRKSKSFSKYRGSKAYVSRARKFAFVGGNLNALNYYGDITPRFGRFRSHVSFTRPGLGIHGGVQYKPNVALRAEFNYGRITGSDEKGVGPGLQGRNLNFRNDIKELSIGAMFNFFRVISANRRPPFNPYVHIGIGVFHHEPYGEEAGSDGVGNGNWVKLRPLGTEGQFIEESGVNEYKPIQISIPFGAGIRMRLKNDLDLAFEVGARKIFTDYIDDVSQDSYPNQSLLSAEARAFSDKSVGDTYSRNVEVRGSPAAKDFFIITQFKLTYNLNGVFGRSSGGKFR